MTVAPKRISRRIAVKLGVYPILRRAFKPGAIRALKFRSSDQYWKERYATGRNSGVGSYGRLAAFKAETLNAYVEEHGIQSVVEHGCGDGNQLKYASYPRYTGIDISSDAIAACRDIFQSDNSKSFLAYGETTNGNISAELAISLDVIYHLIEDSVFQDYMSRLFGSATRAVVVYSSNYDSSVSGGKPAAHVRHRRFTDWVEQQGGWRLVKTLPNRYPFDLDDQQNTSFCDFYFFEPNT